MRAQELSQLQDRVPGFPPSLARSIVEKQLGATLEQSFASFTLKPLAAASLGQVLPPAPELDLHSIAERPLLRGQHVACDPGACLTALRAPPLCELASTAYSQAC